MPFYDRLIAETERERIGFTSIPLIREALRSGVSRELYLDFLTQAYHHVKHTFPLLAFAAAHTDLHRFSLDGWAETLKALRGKPVYLTLDLDVLDPAYMPGTGTPEPGGISFTALLDAVLQLHKVHLVGADIVELAPHYDASGASTAAACKLVREILLQMKGA